MAWNPFKKPRGTTTVTPTGGAPVTTTQSGTPSWSMPPVAGMNPFGRNTSGGAATGNIFGGPGVGATTNALQGTMANSGGQAYTAQQQAQSAEAAKAAQDAANKQNEQSRAEELIRQMTARNLMLLRQGVQGQQGRNINLLRRNLAQRGALDSGSLGAGMTQMGNESSNILAQGTQAAGNKEAERLLDLLGAYRAMNFQREQDTTADSRRRSLMELQYSLERRNKPSGLELFLQGSGDAAGSLATNWLSPRE